MKAYGSFVISALTLSPAHVTGYSPYQNVQSPFATRVRTHQVSTHLQMVETTQSPEPINMNKDEENPRLVGLALQLDEGTRKSHSLAQNTQFVSGFFKGLSTRESYFELLTSYYFVYKAMEDTFDSTQEDAVVSMDYPELRRFESLRMDMEYFYGPNWEEVIEPSETTTKYVDQIYQVAKEDPKLLIAHQYTRYLGDLFGGQMISGMATKSLNLDAGKGVAFYDFEDIDGTTDFITQWYKRLNELNLSEEEKEMIVDEANLAFDFNIGLFGELEGSALATVWSLSWKTLKEKMSSLKEVANGSK